ncbi:type III secretion system translocon subunit SctE [Providencia alcalifaciens]|uniref:type III secretion system translocon subunit SctE n=1 Tax=Providencia alcalifaciens TaxID=126385 RepID=UPI001CC50A4F|nr:type III secretion system translocon subunit SctE [Providencia alcalifaciens]CAG9406850.1 Chromosome partition protein Smc [Providencia alcalifaciens]CAG9406868.1 Chromosome partition protein Smc [Providencia alcalifaciens]CAG9407039.1 Chromosome partition protein Smc [Providencia alcalifaciens]CAG9408027.1 Chromosome partition protein Smc [Providencia alcalifaciens]CAG9408122.1 Chromosome partition protein Smc [Providencia alcalifaciens]
MSQVVTSNASSASTSERINNIHKFLQGANPLGLADESVKAVLALEAACGELASNEQLKNQRSESLPKLLKPKMMAMKSSPETAQMKGFNGNALLIESFASLRQLLHEGNLNELSNRIQFLNFETEALREQGKTLLDTFSSSTKQLSEFTHQVNISKDNLSSAKSQLSTVAAQHQNQKIKLQANHGQLTHLEKQLSTEKMLLAQVDAQPKPHTEAVHQQVATLEANITHLAMQIDVLTQQQHELVAGENTLIHQGDALQLEVNQLQTSLETLLDQASDITAAADADRQKLNQFIDSAPRSLEVEGDKWENTLSLLTMLTAQLKKAMNEDSLRNMKEQEEVMMKINEASRKDSDKKAKEAAEAERKAADANKAASCASKIFSYVMLAVSVIATVATFGAAAPLTLAVAAIGIAMSIADIVLEETGQGSLMQMLATEISNAVTDMLITFGVPEAEAKKIGSIVGMVLAAVAFLAISLLSMSSFVKNIANTVKNVAKILVKNAGALLKSAIKAMPKSLTNALGNIATKGSKVGHSVADSSDEMVKLTKFSKLADKFDDVQNVAKSSDYVSLGGQMVKVGDSAKVAKVADKLDDVKDIGKTVEKAAFSGKAQSVRMARLEVGMKGTGAGLSVANAATSGGLRLEATAQMRDMKEMLAGMMLNDETIQALTALLEELIKSLSKSYHQLDDMFNGMMASLYQSNNNKVDMLKTARFA